MFSDSSSTWFKIGGIRSNDSISRAQIDLQGNSQYYTTIYNNTANTLTENRTLYIPNKSGILAVTSDLEAKANCWADNTTVPGMWCTIIGNESNNWIAISHYEPKLYIKHTGDSSIHTINFT